MSEPDEPVLSDYIDLEAYDVVPGPTYRKLVRQLEAQKRLTRDIYNLLVQEKVNRNGLLEQFEALREVAQEVERIAYQQYLDWMHFHELAMAKPFDAEAEAQDFARRVSSLLTIALGPDSTLEKSSSQEEEKAVGSALPTDEVLGS